MSHSEYFPGVNNLCASQNKDQFQLYNKFWTPKEIEVQHISECVEKDERAK